MNQLHVMVGLPRSGKSTVARQMKMPIVCPDSIRLALHGEEFIQSAEPMVWAMAEIFVKSLFLSGHTDVVVDACHVSKQSRMKWQSPDWIVVYHPVRTPLSVCLNRAEAEGASEGLIEAIYRMSGKLVWP